MVTFALRLSCLFALALSGVVFAQGTSPQQARDERGEWLKTCLNDWDKSTHMSSREWRATCERVASDREKYLSGHPNAGLMFPDGMRARSKQ